MGWFELAGRKWTTLKELPPRSRSLLLRAFFGLIFVAIALPLSGLKTTQKILSQLPQQSLTLSDTEQGQRVEDTAAMVKIAARYCRFLSNCLKKSLVLWQLLRWQGIESELRIGVRRDRGQFEAHAWVEYQGIALNEVQDVRRDFATFDRPIH
ncbi:MAG: lasso peptide biosynthesis B2 protein [Cyanobacteria bacterium SBLK]|nr:lasso peptide biosynthesis B2 protein [Cyanobacteria bacterium SBLK]